jgi:hypothetical protein
VICRLLASQTSDYGAQITFMVATSAESKLLLAAMESLAVIGTRLVFPPFGVSIYSCYRGSVVKA